MSAGASGSLLQALEVPQYAFVSGTATLRCVYDMSDTKLYSLKWYHNNTEFYRYVPTERNGPVNIGPTDIFLLHVSGNKFCVLRSFTGMAP
ncbi:hypothetical protein HAZT_HAZT010112 [Hyalella azteca]|uniref:Ig-like domain-containing protein n=1 Tax=Hyalella azteca TaxID=294128 RepID=A0A6A0H4N4_HYAAZ|nr:hypothetical protein HAZT_HAZT010112 [Hyalella azteca]